MLKIASNCVVAKLINPTQGIKSEVSELLSYYVETAEDSAWSGRSTFFNYKTATFPAGFVALVASHLRKQKHTVQLVTKKAPAPLGQKLPVVDAYGHQDARYSYQMETVERLLKYKRMIAQVATGGGKSRICNLAVAKIKRPTLFLTTRSVLMYQMHEQFEESFQHRAKNGEPEMLGYKCGIIGDGVIAPRKFINVAMVQTISERLKNPATRARTIEFLHRFEFVILEEAHEVGGQSFYDILRECKNAEYRLALTATPFMKDNEEANMRLMATAGPIGIKITEKELIDKGILATPYFKYIDSPMPIGMTYGTRWQTAYSRGIVENKIRNTSIVSEAIRFASYKLPVLCLVLRKKHGEALEKAMKANGVRAKFIRGENDQVERKKTLNDLVSGELDVVIGTNILDVGVDVPAVGAVFLCGGGKAEVALRQRIGRGLRAKKNGPNRTYIVDFNDRKNKHLIKHAKQRRAIVESTPGFCENILQANKGFDLEPHRGISQEEKP